MKKVVCIFLIIMVTASFSIFAQSGNANGDVNQDRDQIQEQKKDGSCKEVACDQTQEQSQDRDQIREQKKDGSCKEVACDQTQEQSQDHDQTREQKQEKDCSCC